MAVKTEPFLSDKNEEVNFVSSFEKLLEGVKPDGRFQWKLIACFLFPLSMCYGIAYSNFILLLTTPKHHCLVPGRQHTNFTSDEWNNLTIPWEEGPDGKMHLSKCNMYNISFNPVASLQTEEYKMLELDTSSKIGCQFGWHYDNSSWIETPVSKFNWVCDNKRIPTIAFTVHLAGSATGTLIFAILSDRFGRKPIFYVALFMNLIFGNVILFAPSYEYFLVFKFLSATSFFSIYYMPYIIVIELCSQRLRTISTYASWFTFVLSSFFLSTVAWLVMKWKYFLLITQLPLFIFIFYWRYIPESPRWLLSRGRLDECEKLLTRIAVANGTKFTEDMRSLIEKAHQEEKKKVPATKIFSSFVLTKHLILVIAIKSIALICALSLNINIHNMKGNLFINYILLRSFELPGDLFSTISVTYLGRRLTAVISMALASIFVMVASFLIDDAWALVFMVGITKLFTRSEIYSIFIQTGELFPTPLRATAYGIAGIVSLVFTVVAPQLVALGMQNVRLPYYIICGLSVTAAFIASFLPETMGNPLPQTLKEAKKIGKGQPYFSLRPHRNVNKAITNKEKEKLQDGETKI